MKALLITTAIAFLLSLLSVAQATTDTVTRTGNDERRARWEKVSPSPDVGSINDETGTESLTHPERDGRTAGSMNDEGSREARQQRALPQVEENRRAAE